jgi:hypothetical protein
VGAFTFHKRGERLLGRGTFAEDQMHVTCLIEIPNACFTKPCAHGSTDIGSEQQQRPLSPGRLRLADPTLHFRHAEVSAQEPELETVRFPLRDNTKGELFVVAARALELCAFDKSQRPQLLQVGTYDGVHICYGITHVIF